MKEDFLHYLWKFKKFDSATLETVHGESVTIVNSGQYLQRAGPDFFNAQLVIGNQKWAGNVEIHIKSSDWYVHHHETDAAYDNVILHVVWQYDTAVFRKNNTEIPVLELQNLVSTEMVDNYRTLMAPKSWIFCEKHIQETDPFVLKNWMERLLFERLERKLVALQETLSRSSNDWESALFGLMAKNFGLNTNGESFLKMAEAIPFATIRKESAKPNHLEALFFGMLGLLEENKEDLYFKFLKNTWEFLSQKYRITKPYIDAVQFFKHRPDNFPTIRLSQLAQLYQVERQLFSKVIEVNDLETLYGLFKVGISDYWQNHYQFDRLSPKKSKMLTRSFVDLLIMNSVVPLRFAYAQHRGIDISEELVSLMLSLPAEKNVVVEKFADFGIKATSAFETQALLQLKNDYCGKGRCLDCAIGVELLKS